MDSPDIDSVAPVDKILAPQLEIRRQVAAVFSGIPRAVATHTITATEHNGHKMITIPDVLGQYVGDILQLPQNFDTKKNSYILQTAIIDISSGYLIGMLGLVGTDNFYRLGIVTITGAWLPYRGRFPTKFDKDLTQKRYDRFFAWLKNNGYTACIVRDIQTLNSSKS